MAVKFFGQYLLEKGIINSKQLVDALDYQKQVNLSIHQLALKKGLLTVGKVEKAMSEQRVSGSTMEQTLKDQGFLTDDQIKDLKKEMDETRIFLGEALVNRGIIKYEQLEHELQRFHEEQGKIEYKFRDLIKFLEPLELIDIFTDTTISSLLNLTNKVLKVNYYAVQVGYLPERDYIVELYLMWKNRIRVLFVFSEETVLDIASSMGIGSKSSVDDEVKDLICEFINIIMGNAYSRLNNEGITEDLKIGCIPALHDCTQEKIELLRKNKNVKINLVYPSELGGIKEMDLVIEYIV